MEKCSIAIIPPGDWQRQGKCAILCGYRYVCAIFIQVIDYRLFWWGAVELNAEAVGVDADATVGNACGLEVTVDLFEVGERFDSEGDVVEADMFLVVGSGRWTGCF